MSAVNEAEELTESKKVKDDLYIININSEFEKTPMKGTCQNNFFKKENTSNLKAPLLNLDISIKHREFECHIEIAICSFDIFMLPFGLRFYALQEQF